MTTAPATLSPSGSTRPSRVHISALDGLRGVAILLVMWHHMTVLTPVTSAEKLLSWTAGAAWCGVDLFFVLSGFLITRILYDTKHGSAYFRSFYARRLLRIFPLYYLVLLAYFILLPRTPLGSLLHAANPISGIWYWLYLSNVAMARAQSFGVWTLGITWSLAIEEQFYLIWPLVVFLCNRRTLLWIAATVLLTVPLLRTVVRAILVKHGASPMAVYVLTPCRIDALAAGAVVALAYRSPLGFQKWLPVTRATVVIAPLLLAVVFFCQGSPTIYGLPIQTAGYSLMALWFAGIVALCSQPCVGTIPRRILNSAALRYCGRYSYALYLLHPTVIALMRRGPLEPTRSVASSTPLLAQAFFYAVTLSCAFILAFAVWHLWEKHFLRLKRYFPYDMNR